MAYTVNLSAAAKGLKLSHASRGYAMVWSKLVPELVVQSYRASKRFYVDVFGFQLCFERLESGFGYFDLEGAQLMLLQAPGAAVYELDRPCPKGKGVRFQIELDSIEPMLGRLSVAAIELALPVTEAWYRANTIEFGQREFFVKDPNGYLFRFFEDIGERPATTEQQPGPVLSR